MGLGKVTYVRQWSQTAANEAYLQFKLVLFVLKTFFRFCLKNKYYTTSTQIHIDGRENNTDNYNAANRRSFRFFRYKCCLTLYLSPGVEFQAVGNEIRGSLLTISIRWAGIK
jgi:hypothetical protein